MNDPPEMVHRSTEVTQQVKQDYLDWLEEAKAAWEEEQAAKEAAIAAGTYYDSDDSSGGGVVSGATEDLLTGTSPEELIDEMTGGGE